MEKSIGSEINSFNSSKVLVQQRLSKAEIHSLTLQLAEAWSSIETANNTHMVADYYTPDEKLVSFNQLSSGTPLIIGYQNWVKNRLSEFSTYRDWNFIPGKEIKIEHLGDTIISRFVVKTGKRIKDQKRHLFAEANVIWVWKKHGENWRVNNEHISSL